MPTASTELLAADDAELVDCMEALLVDWLVDWLVEMPEEFVKRLEEELTTDWLDGSGEGAGLLAPPPPPHDTAPKQANNPISTLRTKQLIQTSILFKVAIAKSALAPAITAELMRDSATYYWLFTVR